MSTVFDGQKGNGFKYDLVTKRVRCIEDGAFVPFVVSMKGNDQ
jgi:hypothetical protein